METWGHSAPGSYVIFCVDPHRLDAFRAWLAQEGVPHKQLTGYYNRKHETSFIVQYEDFRRVHTWGAGQECVLVLGDADARDRRPAWLVFRDGQTVDLGLFYSCSRAAALARDAWTYDPMLNTHFITENEYRPPPRIDWQSTQRVAA